MSEILPTERVLRIADAMKVIGLKRSAFLSQVRSGRLPHPVRIGPKAVGWYESELVAHIRGLPRAA